jgi:cytidylate kinase
MKTFIFIHGPNGIGKSTVCKAVHQRLMHSAWLESEWCRMTNPFLWNDEMISLTTQNITRLSELSSRFDEGIEKNIGFLKLRYRTAPAIPGK